MRRLPLLLSLLVVTTAAALALSGAWPWRRLPVAPPIVVTQAFRVSADTLQRGETVGELFARQGLGGLDIARLARRVGLDPRRLRAGLIFTIRRLVGDPIPTEVVVRTGPEDRLRLTRGLEAWQVERDPIPWTTETVRVAGGIESSLYTALDESVPDPVFDRGERIRLAWDLADVYAWSVDFTRDLQSGDRFAALVERRVSEEGEVRYGRVLAAGLEVGGRTLTAYRFEADGPDRFYDGDGKSLRRAFLRAPVAFRRISSRFSRSRFHPILQIYRRHAGTDYAALAGTPVQAAGDGVITAAGWSGGYGILVSIRHRNAVGTRYAHLQRLARGIRPGVRVAQGEVIGYVGRTGLATAAHLHYEFLVNGVATDPRRTRIEDGPPVPLSLRDAFLAERDRLAALLAAGDWPGPVAIRVAD